MKNISQFLILSLAILVAAPVMAASDKKEAVVEPKREVKTEADVLKELEKYSPAALAQLKAAFVLPNHAVSLVDSQTYRTVYNTFCFDKYTEETSRGVQEFIQLQSSLQKVRTASLGVLEEKQVKLSLVNESAHKLEAIFAQQDAKLWFYQFYKDELAQEKRMKCTRNRWYSPHHYNCKVSLSNELYAILSTKLKENPKFLDDRINKK